ncbi:MAG: FlgO family outer membrane protein [Gemmatimonadota bacterium]|nr:FlgO family outer membrane protein [Gemmatimonadota bacterium]
MTADLRAQLQSTLGTAYTLERELGGGGMSRVFVATETRLRRDVVVKVLTTELAAGVSAERFEREIQLAASLQQANIVPLLSAGDTEGIPYYTMPFVAGESLRARLTKDGPLPIAECVSVLRDVARALSYAHAHGVVHRDIKPDNILLSHGAAVVTDFGIAKAISAARTQAPGMTLTQAGTSIGTPTYMAPEQVAGDVTADHRVDLYAFGCVAYELLTGKPPFVDALPQRVFAAHLAESPKPVRDLRPDTPGALAGLVMRCLEKQPENRPASADDVLRSIETVSTPGGGHATGAVPSAGHTGGRMKPAMLVVAALLLVAVAVWAVPQMRGGTAATADKSIAVMPLANLSGDSTNNYFGEGLAEEITSALAKAGLHVIGRGSARALAARGLDAREIAGQLAVGSVLQGNVQRDKDRVRVSVTLVSGKDGSVLWSEKNDESAQDIFALQDKIARAVATQLRATLSTVPTGALVRQETADPEAHSLYLQGLYLWNRRTAPAIRQAIGLFQQAVTRDPKYGRAHAATALAYAALPYYDDGNTDSLATLARAAADRALAVDSTIADAWAAKAFTSAFQWRNADAAGEFAHAIQLDSTSATARFWYGLFLTHIGRLDEAQEALDRARVLEPSSLIMRTAHFPELAQGKYAVAEVGIRAVLANDTTFAIGFSALAQVLSFAGKHDEAIRVGAISASLPGLRAFEAKGVYAFALARRGRAEDARAIIAGLRGQNGGRILPAGIVAATLMELGDREAALATLQAAVEQHDPWLLNYGRTPRYAKLRADPRGKALLESTERP